MKISDELSRIVEGAVLSDRKTLTKYSRDASLFRVRPETVVFPKNTEDLKAIVRYVRDHKKEDPHLSITGRAAGTDMSGGPLGESLILDFTKHFTRESVELDSMTALVEPGVFYRDFEKDTLPKHISLPVFPASKQLAALGGMIMNNAAGEKTLRYGQIRDFVDETWMVLADGEEYHFRPLNRAELEIKMNNESFEGMLYKKMFTLVTENSSLIARGRPRTSKNSAGYALWRIWDEEKGIFDLSQLFVGSQGTLGLLTKAKLRLVREPEHKKLIAVFLKSWDDLPRLVTELLPLDPESMEVFDDQTLKLGLRFMPEIARKAGRSLTSFAFDFLPEFVIGLFMLGLPKLVLLIELAETDPDAILEKSEQIRTLLKKRPVHARFLENGPDSEKYWIMRRESFNLLRTKVKDKQTAPFIDDFTIDPREIGRFLPRLFKILDENGIEANIAGHAGNGNYHIIPLMDLSKPEEKAKIMPVAQKVYDLVLEFGGTITGEHNDGIIRTPFLEQMFGREMCALFEETKKIFDPDNIFNPGKKVGGTLDFARKHIA